MPFRMNEFSKTLSRNALDIVSMDCKKCCLPVLLVTSRSLEYDCSCNQRKCSVAPATVRSTVATDRATSPPLHWPQHTPANTSPPVIRYA